ncbi:glycine cleavage system aminomethyltransferase GcvT [Cereibacter azotoformans]|uniref:aminomethyltransferase n=1 Tax=Cereibacter azotoformans TaxID=43057 RepID=A0A2T5KC08_9RHOB|nr:glycine cleavage system aminomethyltransferase GcvT [Cereibacter azotoformans]AXQ94178.1 glycine cleavage system aminomethyltransferase GcvT [Cereibacter sphaeroides]MBO4168015.1 glycine cleavage system aminomethyltransferase GcvT [Cereibacter azotoformans]PTR19950.1 aminomethyltransferase [Cereibacter azotoformans]UIJ29715.1 glycine cleavage system aminomethyltransferase GcvT [Cereibacter azotoformans]
MSDDTQELRRLPLHDLHVSLGARMVPFAGWEMPVQYPAGVMKEHLHTRAAAGLFDVSHMGQLLLRPKGAMADLGAALERLMPVDVLGLPEGRQRYGILTSDTGGILDDLMFANRGDHVFVVVNAACVANDTAHLREELREVAEVASVESRGLLALQGPAAETALARLVPAVAALRFMDFAVADWQGEALWISRSGYTGEDGFEISVPRGIIAPFAEALLAMEEVAPIGLGARDSLRLEAGLCLYGHDIDTTTSPIEAGLSWAIQKVRRPGGARAGGFAGEQRILRELEAGPERLRVGLRPEGRAPMREGTELYTPDGTPVGRVTSGGFAPSLEAPVAMGYVAAAQAAPGTALAGEVRGKRLPVMVTDLPFRPSTYKR